MQEPLRIKLLPNPKKPLKTFSRADIRLLAANRPERRIESRSWTLALCLVDTGIRIEEALGLERAKVDLDGLSITIHGKGNKDRVMPMSMEFRKHLFRHVSKTEGRYVFAASFGMRLVRAEFLLACSGAKLNSASYRTCVLSPRTGWRYGSRGEKTKTLYQVDWLPCNGCRRPHGRGLQTALLIEGSLLQVVVIVNAEASTSAAWQPESSSSRADAQDMGLHLDLARYIW